MEPEDFLEAARQNLSREDFRHLSEASIEPADVGPRTLAILRQWQEFELGLRNALVRLRAPILNVTPETYIRVQSSGDDGSSRPGLMDAARQTMSDESPLSAEHHLGRLRWQYLSELAVGHYFDLDAVIVYFLKLQLLARNRLFNRQDGEQAYRSATEEIMNNYYQEQQ